MFHVMLATCKIETTVFGLPRFIVKKYLKKISQKFVTKSSFHFILSHAQLLFQVDNFVESVSL